MRLPVTCWGCLSENLAKEQWIEPERHLLELRDDGAYVWTCPRGHHEMFALQNLRHEVLFEAGCVALLCGFHREAIASVATALERFYEFAIFVLADHHGVTPETVLTAWKDVAKQSERQLGAFQFLYLVTFRRGFPQDANSKKMVELRNEVVHKGHIPTRDAALSFAEYAFNVVRMVTNDLEGLDLAAVKRVRDQLLETHSVKLEKRHLTELPEAPSHRMKLNYGMMLHRWDDPQVEDDDFVWNLEALTYRIKKAGAGQIAEDRPFTRFDPGDDDPGDDRLVGTEN